ncbi:hypothetical protein E2P81_ATG04441 [Venturia nashicola]|nr:hypothetical protein E2P81_ATG04441 [Venturia nashicola]
MPMKGSLRGKGAITGWWSSSPSKHEPPSSPRDHHDLGSSTSSMQPLLPQDEDCIDSPSSAKRSGWFDTINNTIKGKSKKSRKTIKDHHQYERRDSGTNSIPLNPDIAEIRHSSPIPFQPLPEIQPGDPIKSNKALENLIAGPDGYAPSIDSTKEVEQDTPELVSAPAEQAKQLMPLFPLRCVRPPIKSLTSFVMDDVFFEESSQDDAFLDSSSKTLSSTSTKISDAAVQTENLAHLKSSSSGHVDHITGDWHSNDPAGSAIIGKSGRTVSAELRYQQGIMRQCAGTWLEAQSMLTQIQMAMGDEIAQVDPRLTPGTTMADILAWPDPSAFFSERVESERLEHRRQRQELGSELPDTPWMKISEDEAILIAKAVLSWKDCIEKDGVEAFVKAMRNPSERHDFQTCPNAGPYSKHCTADEARIALESFKDNIRWKKRCQSLANIAFMEEWLLHLPPDETADVTLEDWLLDCQIGLGDDDDDVIFVKIHPNRRRGRTDELKRKRQLERKTIQLNKRMCVRTFDKNTVEKRLLRCWLGLSENEPIPTVKTHPRRTRRNWVKRMKTQSVPKATGFELEKTVSLASRGKSMGFLVLPFRTRSLPSSSEDSIAMTVPTSGDDAQAAWDDPHTMVLPALSDNAEAQGLEWDVLMDETPSLEKISPFERDLLVAAEETYIAPETATAEETDIATIGLLGNGEESSARKNTLAAAKVLLASEQEFMDATPLESISSFGNEFPISTETVAAASKKATDEEVDVAEIGLLGDWEQSAAAQGMFTAEEMLLDAIVRADVVVDILETGPGIVKGSVSVEKLMWDTLDKAAAAAKALEVARKGLFDAMKKVTATGSKLAFVEKRMRACLEVADNIIKRLNAEVNQRVEDERDAFIIDGYVMPVAGEVMAKPQEERLLATDRKKLSLAILQKSEEKRRMQRNSALAREEGSRTLDEWRTQLKAKGDSLKMQEGSSKVQEGSLEDQEGSLKDQEGSLEDQENSLEDQENSLTARERFLEVREDLEVEKESLKVQDSGFDWAHPHCY